MRKKVVAVLSFLTGLFCGGSLISLLLKYNNKTDSSSVLKFKSQFYMLNRWLELEQNGRNISEYFDKNGYKNVAIYGLGTIGDRIISDLEKSDINILFAIDANSDARISKDFPVYSVEECVGKKSDVLVVSAIFAFDDIKKKCQENHISIPIISLEDIIYNM